MPTKKEIKLINPKHEPLTVEKFTGLSGLNLSDEQAEKAVQSIRKFVRILYEVAKQKQSAQSEEKSEV